LNMVVILFICDVSVIHMQHEAHPYTKIHETDLQFISRKTELEGELEDTKMELLKERKKHEQIITDLGQFDCFVASGSDCTWLV